MKIKTLWSIMAVGAMAMGAQAALAAGDAVAGKAKFYTCGGCHAIEGYGNAFPTYPVPRLGGQHQDVVIAALMAYKDGERKHGSMEGNAADLSEKDMDDISAYVSQFKNGTSTGNVTGNVAVGQGKSQTCAACHGEDGNSQVASNPRLAGQREGYLVKALKDYKSGARNNPIMGGMAQGLSEQDIKDIAAFYASQKKGLLTIFD